LLVPLAKLFGEPPEASPVPLPQVARNASPDKIAVAAKKWAAKECFAAARPWVVLKVAQWCLKTLPDPGSRSRFPYLIAAA
jgi:hypothetical protein